MSTEAKTDIITLLLGHVTSECSVVDIDQRYDDMLDEIYSLEKVGGPFSHMSASRVLREVDPIAYRCGISDIDWTEEGLVEINGDYYNGEDAESAKSDFLQSLEDSKAEAESDLEEATAEDEDEQDTHEIQRLETAIQEYENDIHTVESHSF